jgi:7-keto-8-aminopelargonate synthetase-like enzyme
MGDGVDAGVIRIRVEDDVMAGDSVVVGGKRLVNFGNCSYLGLNTDPRLKRGAIEAIERFGPVFSTSSAYTSLGLYSDLEERLQTIFDAHVVLPTTTTLGHLAALPVLINPDDVVLVDVQTHASVRLATDALQGRGVSVQDLPHNDMAALETAIEKADVEGNCRIWYLADGVYSMYGDVAPIPEIVSLLDRYPNLHVYLDDAHGFGWQGRHGRGQVLNLHPIHPRMVVIVSLSKSFGAGGAALVVPDPAIARRIWLTGGTLTFSGPIYPAELGAAVVSADIHLSPEHAERQARLLAQIDLVAKLLTVHDLPVMSLEKTPIWFIRVGRLDQTIELTQRLMNDGFYVNPSDFPAVPRGYSGIRFMHSVHNTDEQINSLIESIARHLPEVVDDLQVIIDLTDQDRAAAADLESQIGAQ